ncbi:hypothetical protein D9M68_404460 [compost metagenome]
MIVALALLGLSAGLLILWLADIYLHPTPPLFPWGKPNKAGRPAIVKPLQRVRCEAEGGLRDDAVAEIRREILGVAA